MEKLTNKIDENEFREQQVDKVIKFLDKIGAYEFARKFLSDRESKRQFSFEEFKDFLIRLNGIARDIPIKDRKFGENVSIVSVIDTILVPHSKDKEKLLKEAFDSVDKINPDDEAYLLPATINAVHLFSDGNGRTSRILHTMLTKSDSIDDFNNKLRQTVGIDGRFETPDINPGFIDLDIEKIVLNKHGVHFKDETKWSPLLPDGFVRAFMVNEKPTLPKIKKFVELSGADKIYCFISTFEYLQEKNLLQQNSSQVEGGLALSFQKMEQNLTDHDWDEILDKYWALKKEHVEVLIGAFVQPESYKNMDDSKNLRDYFIDKIETELQKRRM